MRPAVLGARVRPEEHHWWWRWWRWWRWWMSGRMDGWDSIPRCALP